MAELTEQDQVADAFMELDLSDTSEQVSPENAQVEGADAPVEEEAQVEQSKPADKKEETDETQTIEIDPDEPLFEQELTENGQKKVQKLSLKELQQGYLRQADYTRKAQEVAKQRAEVQEVARQASQQAVTQYAQKLDQLQAALVKSVAPELANVDWDKLANEDAFEYVRLSNRAKQINDTLQALESEKSATSEQATKHQQQKAVQEWQQSLEILQRDIPDWGAPVAQNLSKAAQNVGFSDAEVAQWNDHRIIKLAHKAAMYDALQTKSEVVTKRVTTVPRVLKPGAKKATTPNKEAVDRWTKTKGKLNEDGAAVFENFL